MLAGVLLLRRSPFGYLVAFPLLVIIVILLPGIVASTVSQLAAGVSFTIGEIVGPIAGFLLLGLVASWLVVLFLRPLAVAPTASRSPGRLAMCEAGRCVTSSREIAYSP